MIALSVGRVVRRFYGGYGDGLNRDFDAATDRQPCWSLVDAR
jgi:hypothetical protein